MLTALRHMLGLPNPSPLDLRWITRDGWLGRHLTGRIPPAPRKRAIETAARHTNRIGAQPLHEDYREEGGTRTPDVVRSSSRCGDLYAWLVQQRRPDIVVEFGSAFGVSGMYFATGLAWTGTGRLYSFEMNPVWADFAERNIRSICSRVTLTRGRFEEHVADVVPQSIDLAFVDGIHSYDFVMRQFEVLQPRMTRGGLIIFDDIDFPRPNARMDEAWQEIAAHNAIVAAVEIDRRVGIVELT